MYAEAIERQKKVCENVNSGFMAYSVFPGEAYIQPWNFGLSTKEIESGRIASSKFISLFLVGCVDYRFGDEPAHHQTGFIYEVHALDPNNPKIVLAMRIDQDTPAERLAIIKSVMGGDYAN